MDIYSNRKNIYKTIFEDKNLSLIDFLNNQNFDEILEIDYKNNSYRELYRRQGKYFVPKVDNKYSSIYEIYSKEMVHPEDYNLYKSMMNPKTILDRINNSDIKNFLVQHIRYRLSNGRYHHLEICIITGKENNIEDGKMLIYAFDVQNLYNYESGENDSYFEATSSIKNELTGLLNESSFITNAQRLINTKKDIDWCIILMDIKHFNLFDEWYGREQGDYFLSIIGKSILDKSNKLNGAAGYLGQDDFALIVPNNKLELEKLASELEQLIVDNGFSIGFLPAIGVVEVLDKNLSIKDHLDRASIACDDAKLDIKNKIHYYDLTKHKNIENEYKILNEYRKAMKNKEITFYLQPQCRISNKKIVGAESLARWIKKDGTIISPGLFIPVLEKYGFITDLDKYLWEEAIKWLRSIIDKNITPVPISLNVSRSSIFAIDICKYFIDLANKYSVPHNLIKIEITESSYSETTEQIIALVNKLRENGFVVLMDDFGSGYSSLNMLSNIKVDVIKLDALFLNFDKENTNTGVQILESVVNMAKQIAIPIIVEGVENKSQCDFLEDLGCRYVQGFYFYKPMPKKDFENLLLDKNNIDERGFVVKLNEQFRIREFLDKNIYSDSMLNNIIGSVALYSYDNNHVDIIRFNEQFYKAVDASDFAERLDKIERFLPEEDKPKMFNLLNKAMEDKLSGSQGILRFHRIDGTLTSFNMHFYYLGIKEGTHRFYGSADNVTEHIDLIDQMNLIAKYSKDNLIFVKRINNKWIYTVASHGLSDVLNLSPKELEIELNNGNFAKRVVDKEKLSRFMKDVINYSNKNMDFSDSFEIRVNDNKIVKLEIKFICVKEMVNNIKYIMIPKIGD